MSILQLRRLMRRATQAEQEAGSSDVVVVTPSVQQSHPSAVKWWVYSVVTGGTPALSASYNVTSLTDDGVGLLTVNIATDFSSSDWCRFVNVFSATAHIANWDSTAAGTVQLTCLTRAGGALADPAAWSAGGFGDQ